MKTLPALVLAASFAVLAHAEYEELTTLKDASHSAIAGYAKRFSGANPKFEGVVNFGKALQKITDASELPPYGRARGFN